MRTTMNRQPKPSPIDRDPTEAELRYAALSTRIAGLLPRIEKGIEPPEDVHWGHVGSLQNAMEHLVQAAFSLGQITEDEAREQYGVRL